MMVGIGIFCGVIAVLLFSAGILAERQKVREHTAHGIPHDPRQLK